MSQKNVRLEVMKHLEKDVNTLIQKYLIPPETIWQPQDFLPDAREANFTDKILEIQELAKEMPYDFWGKIGTSSHSVTYVFIKFIVDNTFV